MSNQLESLERRQTACGLKAKGLTYAEVGQQMGISTARAYQLIRPPKPIYDEVCKRADYKCTACGITVVSRGQVHRIALIPDYNSLANLTYLCVRCHASLHAALPETLERRKPEELRFNRDEIRALYVSMPLIPRWYRIQAIKRDYLVRHPGTQTKKLSQCIDEWTRDLQ